MKAHDHVERRTLRAVMLSALVVLAVVVGQAAKSAGPAALEENPVAEALASHERATPYVSQKKIAAKKIEVEHRALNDPAKQHFADHPWDSGNPEGMPTKDGRLISAYRMVQLAGRPVAPVAGMVIADPDSRRAGGFGVAQPVMSAAAVARTRAAAVMSGGGTEDPLALTDLDAALNSHETMRPAAVAPQQPAGEQLTMPSQRAARPQAAQAAQSAHVAQARAAGASDGAIRAAALKKAPFHAHQGFTTGSLLRVTPTEFHREMKYDLPTADGRLVSPFEWFKQVGAAPKVAPQAAK